MRRGVWSTAVGLLVACSFDATGTGETANSGQGSASGSSGAATTSQSTSMTGVATSASTMGTQGSASTGTTTSSMSTSSTTDPSGTTTASTGSTGSPVDVLSDDGLLARYYLDEAAMGQGPLLTLDAAPDPLDLPIVYNLALNYTEQGGHRGLDWTSEGVNGSVQATAFGTKIYDTLDGSMEGTIEIVFDSDAVLQSNNSSRYLSIGSGSAAGAFALSVTSDQGFWLRFRDATPNRWGIDVASIGRSVVHLVLDTTQPDGDRAILYLDGVRQNPTGGSGPGANQTIDIGVADSLVIGNTQDGTRAGDQRIFYAALYAAALSADDVANNAAVLLEDDDTP